MLSSFSFGPKISLFTTSTIYLSTEIKKQRILEDRCYSPVLKITTKRRKLMLLYRAAYIPQHLQHTPAPTALGRKLQPEKTMSSKQICLFQTSQDWPPWITDQHLALVSFSICSQKQRRKVRKKSIKKRTDKV